MIEGKFFENGFGYLEVNNEVAIARIALQGAHLFLYRCHGHALLLWLNGASRFEPGPVSVRFNLWLQVGIGSTPSLSLTTRDRDERKVCISSALHRYFRVSDIDRVRIQGLQDREYLDKLDGRRKIQQGEVRIDREIDRVYGDIMGEFALNDARTLAPQHTLGVEIGR